MLQLVELAPPLAVGCWFPDNSMARQF